jgi:Cof subfamily protein (haloacid dehalogenase superfamily)
VTSARWKKPLIALFGIDVDGTLVGSSGKVPDVIWELAAQARAKGIHLALCSGRPAFGLAAEYARHLDDDGWHIFQNGASVVNLATHQSRSTPLPEGCVRGLISQARESGRVLELYGDDDYVVESEAAWAKEHAELLGLPFRPRPYETLSPPLVRAQWLVSPDEAKRMVAPPELEMAESSSPLMPDVRFIGLTRHGVSKGTAMREIAAAYRVDMRDVMYIGDSGNDLSALRVVGHPIAMGNADPQVIEAAQRTVGHVNEAGLADALRIAISSR